MDLTIVSINSEKNNNAKIKNQINLMPKKLKSIVEKAHNNYR